MAVSSGVRFEADLSPGGDALQRAVGSAPYSAFVTPAFAHAQQRGGKEIARLSLGRGADLLSCCLAGTKRGRLHTTVEIFSLPEGGDGPEFAEGLLGFAGR